MVQALDFDIKKHVKDIPDFPKKGIMFRDIMPLFADSTLLKNTIMTLSEYANTFFFDSVVGIESRGFLLATPLSLFIDKPFVAARKKGKLPGDVLRETYALEYGEDCIEMQTSAVKKNKSYLIVDDVVATGGTALATAKIIEKNGGQVAGFLFLIELTSIDGRAQLLKHFPNAKVESILKY